MKNWKDKIAPLVFLAPWIVGFLILTLLPMAMSLYFSFTNYNFDTYNSLTPNWYYKVLR